MSQSEFKKGTCAWCSDETTVYRDNSLCEQCDSDTVECGICGARQHYESKCRHVFQDADLDWAGAGVRAELTDASKRGLFKLLDLMPEGFAGELRVAIRSGRFYTWFTAPLIGGGAMMQLNGMGDYSRSRMWGDRLVEVGESDETAEETADGYHWLASLYKRDTLRANNRTLDAINEWLLKI